MRRFLLSVLPVVFFLGCSAPETEENVVLTAADSSFAGLLADLHAADAVALGQMEQDTFVPDHARRDSVLAARGWTEAAFSARADAYSQEPDRLLAIYNLAVDVAAGR
jgi:hypothetical protein